MNFGRRGNGSKICEKERRGNNEGNAGGDGGKGIKGIREKNGKGEERRGISQLALRFTDNSHGPDFAVF